jgi:adenylate kinase family enzyme
LGILLRMQRVSVVGNSGSGKTTVAAELARLIGAPHLELDSVFHQPGWVPLPEPEFQARVADFIAAPCWVVDGNYSAVRDLVWSRADTVVWLDLPRWQVMRQVVRRTISRAARRAELWNGNVEPWSNFLHLDPEQSILAWAWTRHRVYRDRFLRAMIDPGHAQLRFIRLTTLDEVQAFLAAAGRPQEGAADQPG